MVDGGPFRHVRATLPHEHQRGIRPKAMQLGQIRAEQLEQGSPNVKRQLVGVPSLVPGRWQRRLGGRRPKEASIASMAWSHSTIFA